jgi:DNA-directed RNA polymerase subunit N (RpoN/RPB10)
MPRRRRIDSHAADGIGRYLCRRLMLLGMVDGRGHSKAE